MFQCLQVTSHLCSSSHYYPTFAKPQQWPTPSESIAIYCVRKLVSCITHLQSCAKVDIWNKKKKLRTVANIKPQGYKNWRLPKFSTNVTPPLNTATTLFNEPRSQRPFGTSDWQNYSSRLAWLLSQALQILLNDTYKLNHCKEMGAEPGRRFLKQPVEKLKAVFVAFQIITRSYQEEWIGRRHSIECWLKVRNESIA